MATLRSLIVFGTRPEAIKLAPLIHKCRANTSLDTVVCSTGQHSELVADLIDYFELKPDVSLGIMRPNGSLSKTVALCLEKLDTVIDELRPDCVVAQGDTLTVLAASMAAFFRSIPFVHVEAGLRTGNFHSPWPEEFNRRVASLASTIHCAPTAAAAENLLAEGVDPATVHITGNTVVDALLWTMEREKSRQVDWESRHSQLMNRRMVLITGHRRENMGEKFVAICTAIRELARLFPEIAFVYPVHLNPRIKEAAHELLGGQPNILLLEPLCYPEFVWMMSQAEVILTDSGGIQEEAPTLGKQVLLMRDTSERPESVEAGFTTMVGYATDSIVQHTSRFLRGEVSHANASNKNPYGDGTSAQRIVSLMMRLG